MAPVVVIPDVASNKLSIGDKLKNGYGIAAISVNTTHDKATIKSPSDFLMSFKFSNLAAFGTSFLIKYPKPVEIIAALKNGKIEFVSNKLVEKYVDIFKQKIKI